MEETSTSHRMRSTSCNVSLASWLQIFTQFMYRLVDTRGVNKNHLRLIVGGMIASCFRRVVCGRGRNRGDLLLQQAIHQGGFTQHSVDLPQLQNRIEKWSRHGLIIVYQGDLWREIAQAMSRAPSS